MKPQVNLFLSVYENDFKQLYKGIDLQIPGLESSVKVRGMMISGTCDLPAKATFLNMQQYNGRHGCLNCEIETRRIDHVQVYPFLENNTLRTTEKTKLYAEQALEANKPVFGIKGPSALSLIMYNYIEAMSID